MGRKSVEGMVYDIGDWNDGRVVLDVETIFDVSLIMCNVWFGLL